MIRFLLNQNAIVKPFIKDMAGHSAYGSPFSVKCRIDTGKKLVKAITSHGDVEVFVANAIMFVVLDEPIQPKSEIVSNGRIYKAIRCDSMIGFSSSHLEVYLE